MKPLHVPKLDHPVVVLVIALLAALSHWLAAPEFFFIDDFRSLDWGQQGWRAVRDDLPSLIRPWEGGERPVIMLKIQFIVAMKIFGPWFPGHALLASLPHVGATVALFYLARRLMPGHQAVPAVAALLFGVAPGSALVAWPSAVHHAFLTLATLLLALAYLRYKRSGSIADLVGTLLAAGAVYFISEAATTALLAPLWIELVDRPAPGGKRARWIVVAVCVAGAFTRFITTIGWSKVFDRLSGEAAVYRDTPFVYTLDLEPTHVIRDLGECFGLALGVPALAVIPIVALVLVAAALQSPYRSAIRFGVIGAIFMALPLAALAATRPWDGYVGSAWFILAAVGAIAVIVERARAKAGARGALVGRTAGAVVCVLAVVSTIVKDRVASEFYGDLPEQMRAVYVKLRDDLPRGRTGTVVLYGIPTQVNRSYQPAQMDRFWAGLLKGRRPRQVVIVSPHAAEEIDAGPFVWVNSVDSTLVKLAEPVRRYRLTGGGSRVPDVGTLPPTGRTRELVPCTGAECLVSDDAPKRRPVQKPAAASRVRRADLEGTFLAVFGLLGADDTHRIQTLMGPSFLKAWRPETTIGLVVRDGTYKVSRTPLGREAVFEKGEYWSLPDGDIVFSSDCSTGSEVTAVYRVQPSPDGTIQWTLRSADEPGEVGCLPGPWGMKWEHAPAGQIAYSAGDPTHGGAKTTIAVLELDGLEYRSFEAGSFSVQPVWSPDGQQIVFSENDGKTWDLYLMNADGSGKRPLATGPGDQLDATWSPDATRLALHEGPSGHDFADTRGHVEWTNRDMMSATTALSMITVGDGTKTRIREVPGFIGQTAWSPDGNLIVFRIWRVESETESPSGATRVTNTTLDDSP